MGEHICEAFAKTRTGQKVFIRTFGCQMNDRDSEAVAGLFMDAGFCLTDNPKDADVILVNTCSVRQHAEDRVFSVLGTYKRFKHAKVIGVIGCMAKNSASEIIKRTSFVNLICSPGAMDKLVSYVQEILKDKRSIVDIADRARAESFYKGALGKDRLQAQVVISTGCCNYCSYCIVPFVRGELRLRNPQDIIREIKRNVSLGITKITLLGQNVNDYKFKLLTPGSKPQIITFTDLLKMIDSIDGLQEINFYTSHPKNTPNKLFELMAKSSKIKKHLHLPLQSGSTRILKLMNRGYTAADYIKIINSFRKIVPGGLITTDIIVGFPRETQSDFMKTFEMLKYIKFNAAYIFKYSPRPHAKSKNLPETVTREEKEKRHALILELQRKISNKIKDHAN